jgi:hypothetical protein
MMADEDTEITINGSKLSKAEVMTIRVALGNMYMDLSDGLGDDEHGFAMTRGYNTCIRNINTLWRKT